MNTDCLSRRSFVKASVALAGATALLDGTLRAQPKEAGGPLLAYVGTFSSPLRNTLPTQVDLPPGNGRGIHIFKVDRTTGALTATGVHEMGTSPSCLALNATGTRLYSANETDRVGKDKEGTVSAFAIDRADGKLKPLNILKRDAIFQVDGGQWHELGSAEVKRDGITTTLKHQKSAN